MKRISQVIILLLLLAGIGTISDSFAASGTTQQSSKVVTTELIPGMGGSDLECWSTSGEWIPYGTSLTPNQQCETAIEKRKYRYTIQGGMSSFTAIFRGIVNYIVKISLLLAVLAMVALGIAWSTTGSDSEAVKNVKGWLMNIIAGLLLLFFLGTILRFLMPSVFV